MVILLLFLTSTMGVTMGAEDAQCDLPGFCDGVFIDATLAENKTACISFCRMTPGCSWYSLDTSTKVCTALEDCPMLDESKTNTTSGNKECSDLRCNETGKCHGNTVGAVPAANAASCLRLCQLNPSCSWFTFMEEVPVCVLLADCPELQPCSTCVSGQEECRAGGWNKLMRTAWYDNYKYTWELIDLSNSSVANCPLPDYPFPIEHPAAVLFDEGVVRACGGHIPSREGGRGYTNRCFTFDGFKWEENMEPSREEHSDSMSINVPGIGWWIFEEDFSSSEVFNKNGVWESGPGKPSYNGSSSTPTGFCSVQINSTHTAVIGGKLSDTIIPDVIFYDWTTGEWIPGPPLQTPRRHHDCTSFGNGRMMVTGGIREASGRHQGGIRVTSVETYDSSLDSWYYSENLPEEPDSFGGGLITWDQSPVWLNSCNMWKFDEGTWARVDARPTHGYFPTDSILMVPDVFIPGC